MCQRKHEQQLQMFVSTRSSRKQQKNLGGRSAAPPNFSSSVMMSHSGSPNSSLPSIFDLYNCNSNLGGIYFWVVCLILCLVVGFPASVSILWELLCRRTRPLTPNDFFTLNLATMDAIFLAFIPIGLLNHLLLHIQAVDSTWNTLYNLNMCGRPLLMVCVCLDCYLAVVHPITYRRRKSLTPRVAMAAVVWAVTLAFGVAYFLDWRLLITAFPAVPYAVTIAVVAFCDFSILRVLRRAERGSIHPQKQRALQTLVNSLVVTLISYLPPLLTYSVGVALLPDPGLFLCTASIPISIFSSLGSAIMSLLCLHNLGKLRLKVQCVRYGGG